MKRSINLHISSLKLPFNKKAKLKLEKLGICVKDSFVPIKTDRERVNLFLSKKGHCLPFVKILNKKQNASTKVVKVIDLAKTNNNGKSQKKEASTKEEKKSTTLKKKKQIAKARIQKVREEKTVKVQTTKTTKTSNKATKNKIEQDQKTKLEEQKTLRAKRLEMREKKREEAHWPVWETLEKKKSLKKKVSLPNIEIPAIPNIEISAIPNIEIPAIDFSFNISDSDEDSDDDEKPDKPIPIWAKGDEFNEAMKKQSATVVDLAEIFDEFRMPDLSEMFTKQRKRFNKRTSSAVWDCPPANFRLPFD